MPREIPFVPFQSDQEILDFVHALTGDRKADTAVGKARGLNDFQISVLRQVFGKSGPANTKFVSDEVREQIIEQYKDGVNVQEISKNFDVSVSRIYDFLAKAKCDRNRRDFWTPIKERGLMQMRDKKHMMWKDIARFFGKTINCVERKYKYMKMVEARTAELANVKSQSTFETENSVEMEKTDD